MSTVTAPLAQLLYRVMRDHNVTPEQMLAHIQECNRPGRAQYSLKGLGRDAERLARKLRE